MAMFLLPIAARPDQAWNVMVRFGWTGTWAQNCGAPAGPNNWHIVYSGLPSGQATRMMMRDDDLRLSTIESIQVIDRHTSGFANVVVAAISTIAVAP